MWLGGVRGQSDSPDPDRGHPFGDTAAAPLWWHDSDSRTVCTVSGTSCHSLHIHKEVLSLSKVALHLHSGYAAGALQLPCIPMYMMLSP